MVDPIDELRPLGDRVPDERLAGYLDKVRREAYRVTDRDVAALLDAGITEDEVFEQTVAVAIAEGLRRWDAAERAVAAGAES